MATERDPYRFTIEEYRRMADAGIFTEDDRVELIDGEIIEMSPIGSRHAACVAGLMESILRQLGNQVTVSPQNPVQIGPMSEPEPDIAVLRRRQYWNRLPQTEDVLLLIEVADTTIGFDRRRKLPMYARAGIPEVWLIDLPGDALERHTRPLNGVYRDVARARRGEELGSTTIPELVFDTNDVVGPTL